jgi:processive 1,2-diacylglycerol beta-glucosyltransferase
MDKKILLMYITNVSGHHSAVLAIERAINSYSPHPEVLSIDGFGYAYPVMEKVIHAIYMHVVNKFPGIWDFLYDNPSFIKKTHGLKEAIHRRSREKIKKLIESENCKVVICSQAFPCGMVADYKKNFQSDIKLIAVVTDFIPHSYWVYEEIDFYIVGSMEAKNMLIKKGVKEEKIRFFGIPIDPKFSIELDKKTIADELNISLDKPVILIMGGGHGLGPIKKLINTLDKSGLPANFLVVTGINKKLFNYLSTAKFKNKIKVYGYVDYVDKLMTLADILVTKPGGVTTVEALAKRLPMLIVSPLPGQEQHNTNFLLRQGVVHKAEDINDAIKKLTSLLGNRRDLMLMKERIAKIAMPFSSIRIAELALSLC